MIDDPLLPAARHLFGGDAEDLLRTAVGHAGGDLRSLRAVQAQHRPGSDLVVRYEAEVAWGAELPRTETLLAAATTTGAPAGTLPLVADDLEAGVWRYPFDPRLPGLARAVTPTAGEDLEVVAYRPTRRAVVRVTAPDGAVTYRKVVRPSRVAGLAELHQRLGDAGLPVPPVLDLDEDDGLLTMEALPGDNLRDLLLHRRTGWPPVAQLVGLIATVAEIDLGDAAPQAVMGLGATTASHAQALLALLPDETDRLDRLTGAVADIDAADPATARAVHGDLYEAQVMVTDRRISGLLDLDDVRLGDPLEDAAVALGHLHLLRPATRQHREHLASYRRRLRSALAEAFAPRGDRAELDRRTAAVLVGLATGSFRAQRGDWRSEARRRLRVADRLIRHSGPDERTLRTAS